MNRIINNVEDGHMTLASDQTKSPLLDSDIKQAVSTHIHMTW